MIGETNRDIEQVWQRARECETEIRRILATEVNLQLRPTSSLTINHHCSHSRRLLY